MEARYRNIVGPQVRRLRCGRNWSQNDLAIKLQILGMEHVTRCKVAKIETRRVSVSDDDLIYIARALGVSVGELYPDFIRNARHPYDAICMSKASRYGAFIIGLAGCSPQGTGILHFVFSMAGV